MKIHVIDTDNGKSFCNKAVIGDRAITLDQARDSNNGMYFDCEDCYMILSAAQEQDGHSEI